MPATRLFPTRLEFANPRRNQAALQNPALLIWAVGDCDPQHRVPPRRIEKCTRRAKTAVRALFLEALSEMRLRKKATLDSCQHADSPLPLTRHLLFTWHSSERDHRSA